MQGPEGPWPLPDELQYVGSAGVSADGTVKWQSAILGAISKPSTGNYQFEPLVNLGFADPTKDKCLFFITQLGGPGLTFGVVTGLGPTSTWFQVQFNNPIAVAQQDADFTVAVYQFIK